MSRNDKVMAIGMLCAVLGVACSEWFFIGGFAAVAYDFFFL